jgi:hypothetical protein
VDLLDVHKRPGCQGPIDDAFNRGFLVVLPEGNSSHPRVQQWIEFELAHLQDRWGATFRGEVKTKYPKQLTDNDLRMYNLVCFGDPTSNSLIAKLLPELPLTWTSDKVSIAGKEYDAATHVPVMIYRNPLLPTGERVKFYGPRYIVINSGPTFREAHDRTNSQQNPKLPDWAILDITTPPDAEKPGKVVEADFFDEEWKVKKPPSAKE